MPTNFVIDEQLMQDVLRATGLKTKREAVELAPARRLGITVRKTIDAVIATRCIRDGLTLLYSDRDFDPFVSLLALRAALSWLPGTTRPPQARVRAG
jgi:predicted nucleic acid-binding protein